MNDIHNGVVVEHEDVAVEFREGIRRMDFNVFAALMHQFHADRSCRADHGNGCSCFFLFFLGRKREGAEDLKNRKMLLFLCGRVSGRLKATRESSLKYRE